MSARGRDRAGLFAAGLVLGLLLCIAVVYLYYRSVINTQLAERIFRTVALPAAARLERVEGDSLAVVDVRDVVLRSRAGDTLVAAPRVRLRVHLSSLSGDGPTVVSQVRVYDPVIDAVQRPDGSLNLTEAMVVTAGGETVAGTDAGGAGVLMRDVRIEGGRVRLATPYVPDSLPVPESERPRIRLARSGGATMRIRTAQGVAASLPVVRVGTPDGWRVEVASLSARLTDPDARVLALRGWAEEAPGSAARFRIAELRTERSSLDAAGTVAFGGPALRYDVTARAHPARLADLQWFVPSLPSEGELTGAFTAVSRGGDRVAVSGSGVVLDAYDSRVTGSFAAEVGGAAPAEFHDTRVALEPLRISTLRRFGFGADLPYTGDIRGVLTSASGSAPGSLLQVDLAVSFAPEEGELPTSTVAIQGPVGVGGEEAVRFAGTRVSLQPLHLTALRPLAPEQADRLRGVLRGTAILTGTPKSATMEQGELSYELGDAAPTRLTSIRLALGTEPLRFDVDAVADPISFATLKELYPALPFRAARFAGPIHAEGTADEVRLRADLAGAAGGIALRGTVRPGTPPRFDLSGELSGFTARAVLSQAVPVEGPVSGRFSASGSTEDLSFHVDLTQGDGRFALQGRVLAPGEAPPRFEVSGDVTRFNLGLLVGRPNLFPGPMTGPVSVTGGGPEPYRFNVNLTGSGGTLAVGGSYASGATPSYSLSGRVVGLDIRQLPGAQALPASDLTGTVQLSGSGTTLETVSGQLRMDASGSMLGGMRVDRLLARMAVRDGVLTVDTLSADLPGTARLTAEGTLGLTRRAPGRLDYRVTARDLSRLVPLLPGVDAAAPPKVTGAFVAQGWVAGSVRSPEVTAAFSGQNLAYQEWGAARLRFDTRLALGEGGLTDLSGNLTLEGRGLALPGSLAFDSLRVAANGTAQRTSLRMAAYRNDRSSVAVAGLVELEGTDVRGLVMDSLLLRAGASRWQLARRAEIRWGGVAGVRVDSLLLRRDGARPGSILVDGVVPPEGDATLRVSARNLDLDVVRQTLPAAPDVSGTMDLDATLEGPVSDPELSLRGRGTGLTYEGVATDSLLLTAGYRGRRLVTNAAAWKAGKRLAVVDASVPMHMSIGGGIPSFEMDRSGSLSAHLVTDSLGLALLTSAVPAVTQAAGVITADVVAGGSVERPTVQGWAMLAGGAVSAPGYGVRYDRINGRLTLEDNLIRVDSLQLYNGGPATVNGTIRLADLEHPELYLTATFRGFRPVQDTDLTDVTISGSAALSGRFPSPVVTGDVTVDQGTIYIPNFGDQIPLELSGADIGQIGQDTVLAGATAPGLFATTDIDNLNVSVTDGVWIQSEEARVEITGDLVILKRGEMPQIYGQLQAVRGTYALTIGPLVRDFDVVGGSVRFYGTPDFNPELDITAQHEVRSAASPTSASLDVVVHVTGTLEYPRVALTSNTRPPLPESELLNYLVFGQPTFQSALQQTSTGAAGFAQQLLVQEFVGGIITQELGHLGLPCEYFRLRGRPDIPTSLGVNPFSAFGSTSVECGVQLASNLFLTLETGPLLGANAGLTSQLGMSLDWQVNPHITTRVAREPVTTSLRFMTLSPVEVDYQWLFDLRGTWEFGFPDSQAPLETGSPEPALPGEPAPIPIPDER